MTARKMYSVYDSAVGSYMRPFFCHNDPEAIRTFLMAQKDEATPFFHHPEDYVLFYIGEFEEVTGLIKIPTSPRRVGSAPDLGSIKPAQEVQQLDLEDAVRKAG